MVEGQKMSKSLGNFVPLLDLLARHAPAAIRYLFLQTGYRKPTNYTDESIAGATGGLRRMYENLEALGAPADGARDSAGGADGWHEFDAFLDDDLNTAGALGWLQTRLKEERAAALGGTGSAQAAALARRCLSILGLPADATAAGLSRDGKAVSLGQEARKSLAALVASFVAGDQLSPPVRDLEDQALIARVIDLRNAARGAKDFATSDKLRDALAGAGIIIKDSKSGTEWTSK
jgi:cysteinyl-tRNA synthetase